MHFFCRLTDIYLIFTLIVLPSPPADRKSQTRQAEQKGQSSHKYQINRRQAISELSRDRRFCDFLQQNKHFNIIILCFRADPLSRAITHEMFFSKVVWRPELTKFVGRCARKFTSKPGKRILILIQSCCLQVDGPATNSTYKWGRLSKVAFYGQKAIVKYPEIAQGDIC